MDCFVTYAYEDGSPDADYISDLMEDSEATCEQDKETELIRCALTCDFEPDCFEWMDCVRECRDRAYGAAIDG